MFYIDWRDIQQSVSLPGCGSNYTTNLGRAVSEGAEVEILAKMGNRWTVGMNVGYTDARLAENVYGNPSPTTGARALLGKDGDRVILTPEWTGAANARYDFALNSRLNSYVRTEYKFFGDYTRSPGPATSLYNARLHAGDAFRKQPPRRRHGDVPRFRFVPVAFHLPGLNPAASNGRSVGDLHVVAQPAVRHEGDVICKMDGRAVAVLVTHP